MDFENGTQAGQQQNNPAESAKSNIVESPVPSQSEQTNTNTSVEGKNPSAGQQTPVEGKPKIIARGPSVDGQAGYVLVEDETGKRTLRLAKDVEPTPAAGNDEPEEKAEEMKPDEKQERITEQVETIEDQLTKPSEPYTLDELSAALANGNVDESRVPNEYKAQYANYKIHQAIEARNQQVKAQQEQREKIDKQLSPEEERENMQRFLAGLDEEAEKRAAKLLGFTEEDTNNLEFMDDDDPKLINYKLTKEWYRNELMNNLQQRAAAETSTRQKQAAIYGDIRKFINDAKTKEPNFNAIDELMSQRYKSLSYEEGQKAKVILDALKYGTITEDQTVELRKYYEDTRKEYYAKKTGLSTKPKEVPKPPIVEQPGSGESYKKQYVPDYKALRNANARGRLAWLAEFISNKGQ